MGLEYGMNMVNSQKMVDISGLSGLLGAKRKPPCILPDGPIPLFQTA